MEIILQWSSCQEKLALSVELSDDLGQLAFFVLDFMGLIDDNVMELDFL